jgi:hypothetical protein
MLPAYRTAEPTVAESAYAAQNLTTGYCPEFDHGANSPAPAQDSQASDTGPLGSLRTAFRYQVC